MKKTTLEQDPYIGSAQWAQDETQHARERKVAAQEAQRAAEAREQKNKARRNRRYLRDHIRPIVANAVSRSQHRKDLDAIVRQATADILDMLFEYDPNL